MRCAMSGASAPPGAGTHDQGRCLNLRKRRPMVLGPEAPSRPEQRVVLEVQLPVRPGARSERGQPLDRGVAREPVPRPLERHHLRVAGEALRPRRDVVYGQRPRRRHVDHHQRAHQVRASACHAQRGQPAPRSADQVDRAAAIDGIEHRDRVTREIARGIDAVARPLQIAVPAHVQRDGSSFRSDRIRERQPGGPVAGDAMEQHHRRSIAAEIGQVQSQTVDVDEPVPDDVGNRR